MDLCTYLERTPAMCTLHVHEDGRASVKNDRDVLDIRPFQQPYQFPAWEKAFAESYQLSKRALENLRLTGVALQHQPNGFVCLCGEYTLLNKLTKVIMDTSDHKEIKVFMAVPIYMSVDSLSRRIRNLVGHNYDVNVLNFVLHVQKHLEQKNWGHLSILCAVSVRNAAIVVTLPGGKRRLCEPSGLCALREFREETGLSVPFDNIVSIENINHGPNMISIANIK